MHARHITDVPDFGAVVTEGAREGEKAARHSILRSLSCHLPVRADGMWVSAHACKTKSLIVCKEATQSRTGGLKVEGLQNRILSTVPRPGRVLLAPGVDPPFGAL